MIGRTSRTILGAVALTFFTSTAFAHDSWISRGGFRGPQNGEWCCGASDCFVVPSSSVKTGEGGFELYNATEVVPYKEALPSVDGQYWRCHRPNGTRRCFFAPITAF
ncbi:MAG: hypothetical protein KTR19_08930 [Hyphomicrobiales bacterium]|nr:hypothetical protein [Hyphomicrobiales bacterium]